MRRIPHRSTLPDETLSRLHKETAAIAASANPKTEADRRYTKARRAKWFEPVVDALGKMAGTGERCMFCSGSEASQIEHFQPKALFPLRALTWENFLWACGICNLHKGDQFPLDAQSMPLLLNPVDDNVWEFFFIDEYGNLTPRWRNDLDDFDPRAEQTRAILQLDRQALQESRLARLRELRKRVEDSVQLFHAGRIDQTALRERLDEWLQRQPFQPDVADYFLAGPGRSESPFAELFALLD